MSPGVCETCARSSMKTVENTFYLKKTFIALGLLVWSFGMTFIIGKLVFLSSNKAEEIVLSLVFVSFLAVLPIALVELWLPFAEINSRHLYIRRLFRKNEIAFECILDIELLGPDHFSLVFVNAKKKVHRLYLRQIKNLHKLVEQIESKLSESHSLDGIERKLLPKKERTHQLLQIQEKGKSTFCFFPQISSIYSFFITILVVYFFLIAGTQIVFSFFLIFAPPAGKFSGAILLMIAFLFFMLLTGGLIIFLLKKNKLSIVTLTSTHLEIQRGWEAPIYRISYPNIVSMEFTGSSNALIHVDVEGETKRVRMPLGVFSKADQKKIMDELRKETQLTPVTEKG